MRAITTLSLIVLVTSAIVPSAALAQTDGEYAFTDPEGDAAVEPGAGGTDLGAPAPNEGYVNAVDLLGLGVAETPHHLTLAIAVVDLDVRNSQLRYAVDFTWDGTGHRVEIYRNNWLDPALGSYTGGALYREAPSGWSRMADLEPEFDVDAGRVTVTVPKVYILNADDRIPLAGDVLEDFRVSAVGNDVGLIYVAGTAVSGARTTDAMPDDGATSLELQEGGLATGHLAIEVPEPVRVSNGGSMTVVYSAYVHNKGDDEDQVTLTVDDPPEGWDVRVQSPVRVPAGGDVPVLIIASVPFKHTHGGLDAFNVTATSGLDESVIARTWLGVLHTPIPQPAGHHPDLFLHATPWNAEPISTVFPFAYGFMNTQPAEEGESLDKYMSNGWSGGRNIWRIPMDPELSLGLDFNVEEVGTLAGAVYGRATGEGTVTAELVLQRDYDDVMTLAVAEPQTVTLHPRDASPFSLTLNPTEDADYIPYDRELNMALRVYLETETWGGCCVGETTPALSVPDFKLSLPLNEYHDRISTDVKGAGAVDLVADGPVERTTRPGRTLTYPFTLTNLGPEEDTFAVEVAGSAAEHADAFPADPVTLKPLESTTVTLGIRVPENANDGQPFEALVIARSVTDSAVTKIARTLSTAAVDAETADESEALEIAREAHQRDSPAPGVLALLGAVVVAVASTVRSRRRSGP